MQIIVFGPLSSSGSGWYKLFTMDLSGSVADQQTGKPLANAQVWEIFPDGRSAVIIGSTDYAGRYNVTVSDPQSTVNFAVDGYTSTAIPAAQAAASDQILLPPDGSITAQIKLSGVPSWLWLVGSVLVVYLIGGSPAKKR
jgi:Tol biopolymer transport system component